MNRREFLKMGGMSMMALVLGGCGLSSLAGQPSSSAEADGAGTSSSSSSAGAVAAGSKTLVVYYSATGRTERVAKVIAKERQADIMKLVPNPDYTEADLDYNDKSSRVSREHDDASLREKIQLQKAVPDNWASYDTVFIGYPIWWAIAAWPVDAFVKANDFTGKNVVVIGGGAGWYFKIYRPKKQRAAESEADYGGEYDGAEDYDETDPEDDGPPWDEDGEE